MDCLSSVSVIACLVSISIVMQEAEAQDCSTPKTTSCSTTYANVVEGARGDKKTICSAANTYLDCLNKVATDCKLDPGTSIISQTIADAKQALSQFGCGSGTDAHDCASQKIKACSKTYNNVVAGDAGDMKKICSLI
ncbi:uncharacterized protein LOC143084099 [Mytilus galloprovincialis]|uniref:uncharacterized protein LOC143084099 n=1 Tax=Mytilus galloprovincialis TaxID=29158 RepID=UPI003F7B3EF9